MIPLITTLALSIVSFFASTFVIIRIVLPILPPHPLSRRVRPSEFGLPDFRSLSAADKSHVWLAACDIIALFLFIAEVLMQYYGSPAGYSTVSDVGSSVRLWLALSLRPTCLLVISSLTLLHVRLGKPVIFGACHWMLWMPTIVLVAVSTAAAGVIAGIGPKTFFFGTIGYTSVLALGSTVTFAGLAGTLFIIKRNLQAIEDSDSWPPAREEEHKPRPSFATADIDALRDGSSWITSRADSDHESISAFSFSTHNTHIQNPAAVSNPSIHPKSSYWFNPSTPYLNGNAPESVPPVPPIPSPYRGRVCGDDHPDPFRRSETPVERAALTRNGSQGSWLSTTTESRPTLSAWSFSTSCPNSPALDAAVASTNDVNSHLIQSRPNTPAMSNAQVLGGYGYVPPSGTDSEKGFPKLVASDASGEVDVSVFRIVAWLAGIWIPFGLSIPYLATLNPAHPYANMTTSILLILSITLSSPLLAVNILMRHGIPIPTGLFDAQKEPPSIVHRAPSPADSFPLPPVFSTEYKRSTSTTVVEGRRSTDVWLAKGEAVDGRSRVGRALGMLAPAPKLSVLPPEDVDDAGYANVPLTPPLPIQDPTESLPSTPQSEHPGEIGRYLTLPPRSCEKSSTSSAYLSADESGLTAHVMVAQRHYSHKALTLILPPSPKEQAELSSVGGDSELVTPIDPIMVRATGTSAKASTPPTHLRTRSVSSLASPRFPVSPGIGSPMQSPLTHRPRSHKKAHSAMSAASFDFGTVPRDDTAEIDKLSAGLLPLLVPGLKVGADVRILTSDAIPAPAGSLSKHTSGASWHARASGAALEFGGFPVDDLSSPQIRTTPHRRARKTSTHKRHHLSLPSFAFGKDGIQSLAGWVEDTDTALSEKIDEYAGGDRRKSIALMQTTSRPASSIAPQSDSFLRTPSRPSRSAAPTPPPSERLPEVPVRRTPRKSKRAIPEDRNSLALLIAALEQPASPLPSASSEQTLFDREGIAPLAESTPPDYRHRSNSRPSISYVRSDANPSSHGDAKPRRILHRFRPVALGGDKRLPAIESSPDNAQAASENVAPPTAPVARGLRPLSLLQDRPAAPAVRGLSVNKKSSKSKRSTLGGENGDKEDVAVVDHIAAGKAKATAGDKENRENPGVSDSSVGKKHKRLRSLKLGRSDTTKERAALRTRENIPNVIVRPPSDVFSAFVGFR